MTWSASSGEAYHITTLEKTFFNSLGRLCRRHGARYGFHLQLFLDSGFSLSLFCTDPQNLSLTEARQRKREPYDISGLQQIHYLEL